ncbi:MAG: ATP-dependent Clp protease ATP-binding subunit ClpC, partial [Clostridia bacterium]|nr:ATP-dependent Clp protease ATP-binding subunit ClpC [Clostridia bacterium]
MNKFTETATGALNLALECARELGHSFIGSQHLLFGLSAQEGGLTQPLLRAAGADADTVAELIERQDGRGARSSVAPCDLTPRSKRIIEASYPIAASFGCNYIGTEHLLLALLDETGSAALLLLSELGVDPLRLAEEVTAALQRAQGDKAPASQSVSRTPTLKQFS